MMIELVIIAVLILLNGFFSMSEMAVMTSRKPRLSHLAQSKPSAARALKLAEQPERFLSAVQVGITLISIITGAYGGATLAKMFEPVLLAWGMPESYSAVVAPVSMVGLVTFFTILFGELVPKRVALLAPERIAMTIAGPMQLFAKLAAPFVWLLSKSTQGVLRLLGADKVQPSVITEEELRLVVHEGHEQGLIDEDERNMMHRVMRLGDRNSESFMTPRIKIEWLDIDAPLEENLEVISTTPYSRYPVYRGDDSDVVGILEIKSLTHQWANPDIALDLFAELREPLYVSESTRAMALLEKLRDNKMQMALVVDEYGDIQGLTTQNDVLSAVLGQLRTDSYDPEDEQPSVTQRDDGSYLMDGALSTEYLREVLNLSSLPGEEEHEFHTLAGMLVVNMGAIPAVGESMTFGNWRFEVVDLDGPRIDKLLVSQIQVPPEQQT